MVIIVIKDLRKVELGEAYLIWDGLQSAENTLHQCRFVKNTRVPAMWDRADGLVATVYPVQFGANIGFKICDPYPHMLPNGHLPTRLLDLPKAGKAVIDAIRKDYEVKTLHDLSLLDYGKLQSMIRKPVRLSRRTYSCIAKAMTIFGMTMKAL